MNFVIYMAKLVIMCGTVAEWLGSQTCDQQVTGLNSGSHAAECNPGQVMHTPVCHQAV